MEILVEFLVGILVDLIPMKNKKGTSLPLFILSTIVRLFCIALGALMVFFVLNLEKIELGMLLILLLGLVFILFFGVFQIISTKNYFSSKKDRKYHKNRR